MISYFRTNVIIVRRIGCTVEAVTKFPVVIIRAIRIGKREFRNPTRLFTVSFIKTIVSAKLVMISVTINIYCT